MDIALATCMRLPEPDPDAAPLSAALAAAGIDHAVLAWDDPDADWSRAAVTVLRSTWNYPRHAAEFLDWAERVASTSRLWNPLEVVRWNLHKRYLLDLEGRGIPVTPTELVRRGERVELGAVMERRGWDAAVVKPAISAASFRTLRVDDSNLDEGESHLRGLATDRDVLVQAYLPSVEDHGERAVVWIDGELTHAVRKSPRFSGQDESVSDAVAISDAERDLALRAVGSVEGDLLYARIDMAPGIDGAPVVMELELIEPSLFFPASAAALERFIEALRRHVRGAAPAT